MSASLGKKVLKWTVLITPWLLALVLGIGWGVSAWAPGYLEGLVPRLALDMGIPLTEFKVRNAGLFSADIGPVRLGQGKESLRIGNVHVTYTPTGLKAGRVDTVTLEGLTLSCGFDGEKFLLPVLDMLPPSQASGETSSALPEIPLSEVTIRDALLDCDIIGSHLSVPVNVRLTPGDTLAFDATLTPRDQAITVTGELGPTINDLRLDLATTNFHLGAITDFLPIPLRGQVDLTCEATADLSDLDSAHAKYELHLKEADLSGVGVTLAKGQSIDISGTVQDREVRFAMPPVQIDSPMGLEVDIRSGALTEQSLFAQFNLTGAGVRMGGRLEAEKHTDDQLWDVALTAANPKDLEVIASGRKVYLAGFIFSAQGVAGTDSADFVLNCATRGTALAGTGLRSGAMRASLPLKWPAPKRHTPGTMSLRALRFDKHRLGNVSATLRQEDTDLTYAGSVRTDMLPGLRIPFSGVASMVRNFASLDFAIRDYTIPAAFNPGTLSKSLNGATVAGTINAEGSATMDIDGLRSNISTHFTNGRVSLAGGQTVIEGININFASPDLMSMRSAPAQTMTFKSLTAGAIALTNGEVIYQLEPNGVILFEQAGFDWCGGHVASRAFRASVGQKKLGVTMFCSQLKLSEILEQLGLAEAKGEASLSGELPVVWNNGKITFNQGFLHSTPGETGVIQVEAMDDLVGSIPEGTPQRGQLELAREAVRNFEYKWVRIRADTVGRDLVVRLSVDGKPTSTLPFVYKREFGGFMRVTGDMKGSNFQGIRLDVNFSVPLDRILLYKDIVNMIE